MFTRKFIAKIKPGSSNKIKTQFIEESVITLIPLVKLKSITEAYKVGKHTITNELIIGNNNNICIERSTFIDLQRSCLGSLETLRHTYEIKNNVAFLDIFKDKPFPMIVSVNFETEDELNNFIKPDWFGEEVTNNELYTTEYLAIHY